MNSKFASAFLVWSFLACLACQSLPAAYPDPPATLITMTNQVWKYNQNGLNLGTAWRSPNYNDSLWPEGKGVFAALTNEQPLVTSQTNTLLSLTNGNNQIVITFYFRTHFQIATNEDLGNVLLSITNLVDDGAVFYVNGAELWRYNMAPAPSPITYVSGARTSIDAEYVVTNLSTALLVRGDNVLAVEVHIANQTDKDVVFGAAASLVYLPPTPLSITNEPVSSIVSQGSNVTLRVGVSGRPVTYQWFKDGMAIPGADTPEFSITNAAWLNEGAYYVTASNELGVVTSRIAYVTVLADVTPPTLVSADGSTNAASILATFSEPVSAASATNALNYTLTNTAGGTLAILKVVRLSATNVLLATEPRNVGANYLLLCTGIEDISPQANTVPVNSVVPVTSSIALVTFFSHYRFYNPYPPYDDPNVDTNWNQPGFVVPESWGDNQNEPGAFWVGQGTWSVPKGKQLSQSPAFANYFIAHFDYAGSPVGVELELRHLVDSGAVFYLNGAEILRTNLPAGPIDPGTPAYPQITNATLSGFTKLPPGLLRSGRNTFAVELRSATANENTLVFAAELRGRVPSLATGPIVIFRQPQSQVGFENGPVTFSAGVSGASAFQWFRNGVLIPGANDSVLHFSHLTMDLNQTFFSVVMSNQHGYATSESASLTVLPDVTPPRLIAVELLATNLIRLSFSEPMDVLTATNINHYTLTNPAGINPSVLSARLDAGTNVLLAVTQPLSDKTVLRISNVRDSSSRGNAVLPGTGATLGWSAFFPMTSTWNYSDAGQDLGTDWRNLDFNDSGWSKGRGLFYIESADLPAAKNTPLVRNGFYTFPTYYFRKQFFAPLSSANATLNYRHIVDDGIVFYMNGMEIHRLSMPSGTITYNTLATSLTGDAVAISLGPQNLTNLLAGENSFAAEVHSYNNFDSDVVFGVECTISVPGTIFAVTNTQPQPVLHLALPNDGYVYWQDPQYILEESSSLGPNADWRPVANRNNPFRFSPANQAGFYRLRR